MFIKSTCVATVWAACAFLAGRAPAATVTYTMRLNERGIGTFDVYAEATQGDNFGIYDYSFRITGVVSSIRHRSPKYVTSDPEEQSAGFTSLRSPDGPQITASQDFVIPNLIRGFGQVASSFVANGITPGLGSVQPVWGVPLSIAHGNYDVTQPYPGFNAGGADAYAYVISQPTGFSKTQANVQLNVLGAESFPGAPTTYTPASWGETTPSPTNGSSVLLAHYSAVYPFGHLLESGLPGPATFSIAFLEPQSVINYLPSTGPDAPLAANFVNPPATAAGEFGGEVLALRLNVDFSDAGFTRGPGGIRLGDLWLRDLTPANYNGLTVRQLLDQANIELGGGAVVNNIAAINPIVESLNGAFIQGIATQWAVDHLRLPGDFEEDRDVDGADLSLWRAQFGASVGATHMHGDADGDRDSDGADFLAWQRQSGFSAAALTASAAVPEPRTWLILGVAACCAIVANIGRRGSRKKDQWHASN